MLHRLFGICLFVTLVSNPLAVRATPPTANNDSSSTAYNERAMVYVSENDTPGSAPLDLSSVTITSGPSHGQLFVDTASAIVEYTPDGDFVGQDTFSYTIKDTNGEVSNAATVTVTLTNQAPTITQFEGYPFGGGMWFFSGMVEDEDPLQLLIEFGGALEGHAVAVGEDGSFFYSATIGPGNAVTAQTDEDVGGLRSNIVAESVQP